MDTLKFLLINPTSPLWQVREGGRPRGSKVFRYSMLPSLYVAASMPPYVETRIVDEDVEAIDFDADVDLVGISFMTFNAPRAYAIADVFRREKGKPVVFGGYHPTFMREEAAAHADALCIGEAEPNVPRMIEDFVAGRLRPVYDAGLADLSGLPVPDRSLIRGPAYVTPDVIQATRGCPYRCDFCSIAAFHRYKFRARPVEEVIAELKTLGRYVLFMDDNILGSREYARELFARMIPLRKQWFTQCSMNIAYDPELLRLAARSGCRGMFVGFESLSPDNIAASNKRCNRERDYAWVVDRLHAEGIAVFAGFVFGMDHDTPDVFRKTLAFLHEAKVDALQATNMTPFPGTPLFDRLDREGRIFSKDWTRYDFGHVVFEPRHMDPETLERGTAWVLREFYARRAVARRLRSGFRYMGPSIVLKALLPVNLGYRIRFKMNGMMEKGKGFVPPRAEERIAEMA